MSIVIDGRLSRQGRGSLVARFLRRHSRSERSGAARSRAAWSRKQIPRKSNVTARHAVVSAIVSVCTSSYSLSGGTGGVHFRPRRPVSWRFRAVPPRLPPRRAAASFWNDRRLRPLVFFFLGSRWVMNLRYLRHLSRYRRKVCIGGAPRLYVTPFLQMELQVPRITRDSASRNEDLLR